MSESTKEASAKIENDSDIEETNSDSSWRKQILIFISEFVKRFSSKKSDKIFNPDTSAVIYSKDSKQNPQIRFMYHDIIRQPMNLEILRKRVESGQTVNNVEFKRDFILMVVNALMFNMNAESEVRYKI